MKNRRERQPLISFEELAHFDTVRVGEPVTYRFPFINLGWGPLQVKTVWHYEAGCQPTWTQEMVDMNAKGEVVVTCTFAEPGWHKSKLEVEHNSPEATVYLALVILVEDSLSP